jgi:hypothetical protein
MTTQLNVSLIRRGGGGYAPLGLCFAQEEDRSFAYRMVRWGQPGDGRAGLFFPPGVGGRLPERVCLQSPFGERLGSGSFVAGLRAVMLRLDALPQPNASGEIWLRVCVAPGCEWQDVPARSGAGTRLAD